MSASGRPVAFYGGPLSASRVELDELPAELPRTGGRYVLAGGAYYWQVGGAAAPEPREPEPVDEPEPASAAPRPRTRARKRPAA